LKFKYLAIVLILLCLLTFVSFHYFLVVNNTKIPANIDAVFVFGFPANENGNLSTTLKSRMDKGIEIFKNNNAKFLIVAGGAAHNNIVEADVMEKYAIKKNINPNKIIKENKSKNTIENTRNVLKILKERKLSLDKTVLISSKYHSHRVTKLYKKNRKGNVKTVAVEYPKNVGILGKWNALFREIIMFFYHLIFGYEI